MHIVVNENLLDYPQMLLKTHLVTIIVPICQFWLQISNRFEQIALSLSLCFESACSAKIFSQNLHTGILIFCIQADITHIKAQNYLVRQLVFNVE